MPPMRPFKEHEVQYFLNMPDSRTKLLLIMGIYSGFRISELLSLQVGDLFQNGILKDVITVKKEFMKNKKASHSVPMHPYLTQLIPRLVANQTCSLLPIFPSRQG